MNQNEAKPFTADTYDLITISAYRDEAHVTDLYALRLEFGFSSYIESLEAIENMIDSVK